ncbi:hypothetical protein J2Z60_000468 [Lactobacillus colini]|uniref:DUF3173 domain-containing protein n=1 Tax=Lactobacillus colini TaxID=1819254 RepID=A0ABS4MD25_9LACO|nr:DUF3173 family protein [Lactobacillus colini]MBP2057304.1 hypothetical protein [Lactobacillus colini]
MKKILLDYTDLRKMGFGQSQSRRIICLAKKELVKQGYGFYNGKRVGLVPAKAIADIIGIPLKEEDR